MGEVYRAKDARLGRDVALKVLPPALAKDPEHRARFEREARAASSLNHPHICVIYDVGSQDGVDFLVMELLEGETAADAAARGPMLLADVMRTGAQMADALDRAHKKNLIHRDVKPANIMLVRPSSKSGPLHAKLLDFGLARPTTSTVTDQTMTKALTAAGTIVGTFQYMSPEQVEGRDVDARTDIWSLGATLYEMATGVRAFEGSSTASLISAVLRDEPKPMSGRVPLTPPAFQRVVSQCLAKDPEDRWQSAGDVKRELDWIASGGGSGFATASIPNSGVRSNANTWITRLIVAAALVLTAATAWWFGRSATSAPALWSNFAQLTDASGVETAPSLSPDGSSIAYSSAANGSSDIYVQRVGGRNPVLVAGDPGRDEDWPAYSPDGKQIAFNISSGSGGIFVVGATGESVRRLTDAGSNPAWSPNSLRIVYASEQVLDPYQRFGVSTLWTVGVDGGTPIRIDDGDAVQPAWSPSGKRIAFWQNVNGQRDIATIPEAGGPHVLVTNDAAVDWAPVWSPDGKCLYFASDRGGSMGIWRIGIDEGTGKPMSAPEPIAAGVDIQMDLPHVSFDGTSIVFRSKIESVNPAAIAFDPITERAGAVTLLQHRTGKLMPTDVSPDGKWIALNNTYERQQDIFIMRPDGSGLSRVTDDDARDWIGKFTPDSAALTFQSNKAGKYDGWLVRLDGSGRTRLTSGFAYDTGTPLFSADMRRLMVALDPEVWIGSPPWPMTSTTAKRITIPALTTGRLLPTTWSRDGRWLGGTIAGPAGNAVGIALFDVATSTIRQLNADGVTDPLELPGGTRVIFLTAAGALVVQDIHSLKRREIPVAWPLPSSSSNSLAVSPDGTTIYYAAAQTEANIWKVSQPKVVKK